MQYLKYSMYLTKCVDLFAAPPSRHEDSLVSISRLGHSQSVSSDFVLCSESGHHRLIRHKLLNHLRQNTIQFLPNTLDQHIRYLKVVCFPDKMFTTKKICRLRDQIKKLNIKPRNITSAILSCLQISLLQFFWPIFTL